MSVRTAPMGDRTLKPVYDITYSFLSCLLTAQSIHREALPVLADILATSPEVRVNRSLLKSFNVVSLHDHR